MLSAKLMATFHPSGEGSGALNTVQVGERTVWVEAGRDAILAAVVTGHAPESLRVTMVEALEKSGNEVQTVALHSGCI